MAKETSWKTTERPGYLGSKKKEITEKWDKQYGEGNWRISWRDASGNELTYEDIFNLYVEGYAQYFRNHPDEAKFLTDNYSYSYDIDLIPEEGAYDKYYAYEKLHTPNQFHHVALNLALRDKLHMPFKGSKPIQARGGKPGTPENTWPAGWRWHPGRIPCTHPDLIPKGIIHQNQWWDTNSVEDLYQSSKVLQVKES